MRFLKRVAGATVLLSAVGSFFAAGIQAANLESYYYQANLGYCGKDGSDDYTEYEVKEDTSPCYVYVGLESDYGASYSVYGSDGECRDLDVDSQKKYIEPGRGEYLSNYVHEYGYDYAGIHIESEWDEIYSVFFGWNTDTD